MLVTLHGLSVLLNIFLLIRAFGGMPIVGLAADHPAGFVKRQAPMLSKRFAIYNKLGPTMELVALTSLFDGRKPLWWINEIGIVLEIIGAVLIVLAAFKTRSEIRHLPDSWDGGLTEKLRDVIADQAITERRGFILLALGLLGQLAGGFQ
ncbi:MAG TPA: hypothetical protein VGE12_15005 [Noviherbaspirillum sp.]